MKFSVKMGGYDTGGKFAASNYDTGGKFATGINDTGGKVLHNFPYSVVWETMGTIIKLLTT
jgi:hypothetical protein